MKAATPYDGSLLRLALTTIGFLAFFAVAVAAWQESIAANRRSLRGHSLESSVATPVTAAEVPSR